MVFFCFFLLISLLKKTADLSHWTKASGTTVFMIHCGLISVHRSSLSFYMEYAGDGRRRGLQLLMSNLYKKNGFACMAKWRLNALLLNLHLPDTQPGGTEGLWLN